MRATRTATLGAAAAIGGDLAELDRATRSRSRTAWSTGSPRRPATPTGDWLADNYGLIDRWPVVTEPFRQWVVEDSFAGDRPPLDELDVIVTDRRRTVRIDEAAPAQRRPLVSGVSGGPRRASSASTQRWPTRCSAGSSRRSSTSRRSRRCRRWPGSTSTTTSTSSIERFSNPQIGDQIARLCLDGSAKFPKFLLPTVRSQLAGGGPVALSALALAGWCQYLNGTDQHGNPITRASDPALDAAVQHAQRAQHDPPAFLEFSDVFGADLAAPGRFADAFVSALTTLRERGVRSAIDAALQEVVRPNDRSID